MRLLDSLSSHPRTQTLLVVGVLTFPSSTLPLLGREAEIPDGELEQRIDNAIDYGVDYLLREVQGPGGWAPVDLYAAGRLAVQLYALLKNDVSYLHSDLQEAINTLDAYLFREEYLPKKKYLVKNRKVYSVSLSLMAFDAVLEQLEGEKKNGGTRKFLGIKKKTAGERREFRRRLDACADWLLKAKVLNRGVWTYEPASRRKKPEEAYYDHSNTQFAVLALGVAARRGFKVPRKVWQEIADQFIMAQEAEGHELSERPTFRQRRENASPQKIQKSPLTIVRPQGASLYDGSYRIRARGWGYTEYKPDTKTTFSMTSAAQSSLLLAHLYLAERSIDSSKNSNPVEESQLQSLEQSIRDGYGWLTKYLQTEKLKAEPYALYSLEKAGDVGEVESFGTVRWFEAGARILLSKQGDQGQWGQFQSTPSRHKTALALLYLGRATALEKKQSLVRYTGERRPDVDADFSSRYWAYLPSLEASVPTIRFFRQLRYRPDAQLVKLSEELLDFYEPDYVNDLALFFRTLEFSPFSEIRELGLVRLRRLTGLEITEPSECMEWVRQWSYVVKAGRQKNLGAVETLKTWLKESKSRSLIRKILWAFQQLREISVSGDLIALMASEDLDLRRAAHDALTVVSGRSFPFDPQGTPRRRAEQLARWQRWWGELHDERQE